MQSHLRGQAKRIGRLPNDESLLIGLDSQGIGAVVNWVSLDEESHKILAIAVAQRHRHKHQGAHGREALSLAVGVIEQAAVEARLDGFEIHAWIDSRNWSSQTLFDSQEFVKARQLDDYLHEWTLSRSLLMETGGGPKR